MKTEIKTQDLLGIEYRETPLFREIEKRCRTASRYLENTARAGLIVPPKSYHSRVEGYASFDDPDLRIKISWEFYGAIVRLRMEETKEMITMLTEECDAAKGKLQTLVNELNKICDIIHPSLAGHIKDVREHRMSVVSEATQMLNSLKELRKFFLDSDYHTELERLREFVSLCKELKALKEEGVLDALSDTMIRLAIKEESK